MPTFNNSPYYISNISRRNFRDIYINIPFIFVCVCTQNLGGGKGCSRVLRKSCGENETLEGMRVAALCIVIMTKILKKKKGKKINAFFFTFFYTTQPIPELQKKLIVFTTYKKKN